jgi:hypothetical protein
MNLRPFTLAPLGLALALQAGAASPATDHKPIASSLKKPLSSKLKNHHTAVSSMGFVFNTKEFMPVSEIRPGMRLHTLQSAGWAICNGRSEHCAWNEWKPDLH